MDENIVEMKVRIAGEGKNKTESRKGKKGHERW